MITNFDKSLARNNAIRFVSPSGKVIESEFQSHCDALAEGLRLCNEGVQIWDWKESTWRNRPTQGSVLKRSSGRMAGSADDNCRKIQHQSF